MTLAAGGTAFPVGATVTITLPEQHVLVGAVLLYGVPLAALLLGAASGAAVFESDLAAAIAAGGSLLLALLAVAKLRPRVERMLLRRLDVRRVAQQ